MPYGELFALGSSVCWAVGPLIAHAGVDRLGTFRFSMLRFAISAVALGMLAAATGQMAMVDLRSLSLLAASGVLGVAFGEACLFHSVFLLGPRIASILFSIHAPLTAFIGALIFDEVVKPGQFAGIALAVSGVMLAIGFRSTSERPGGRWHGARCSLPGLLLALLAVLFQICGALLSKAGVATVEPFAASFIRTAGATLAFLPVFLLLRERQKRVSMAGMKIVVCSAGISTIGGMTLLLAAFANTELYRAVILSSLAPVLYIVIMTTFAGERFPPLAWCGTIMAVIGIGLSFS